MFRHPGFCSGFGHLSAPDPSQLDWKLYNDIQKSGPDTHHDHGELLEITNDRAHLIHTTINALLARHPNPEYRP